MNRRHFVRSLFLTVGGAVLLALGSVLRGAEEPKAFFLGDLKHPVTSGEAWLIANRWGAYQAVLVATIRRGALEEIRDVSFPQFWAQAFDYKVLLAISDQKLELPVSLVEDYAYGTVEKPEYLNRFQTVYLSAPMAAENRGMDWRLALEQMAHREGIGLVLPRPTRRRIRLLYPDGRPLKGVAAPVSLYGSSSNHCGVAVGVKLGLFKTDERGAINFVTTNSPVAISIPFYEWRAHGPAGKAFESAGDVVVEAPGNATVRKLWTLPKHDYELHILTPAKDPVSRVHLEGCMVPGGCGAGCGPLNAPKSNSAGILRFRTEDLRNMQSLTAMDEQGNEREFTESEMRELLTSYRLELIWE